MGAKPGAVVPAGDAIYCANAAFLSAPEAVAGFERRVIVASSTIMAKGLPESGGGSIYRTKLDAIRDFEATELVLFEDPGRGDKLSAILAYIRERGSEWPLRVISVAARTQMVRSRLGSYPLIDVQYCTQPLAIQLRDAIEIGRWAIRWQLGRRRNDVRAKYRPSTGILALLVAMSDYGDDAEYVIVGIGLADRQAYSIDGQVLSNGRKQPSKGLPIHTGADAIALRLLKDRFTLSSTEPELQDVLPPFP